MPLPWAWYTNTRIRYRRRRRQWCKANAMSSARYIIAHTLALNAF